MERDPLTGRLTRKEFLRQVAEQKSGAVVYLDVDDMRAVNDAFGHDKGDAVLAELSALVGEACPEALVGRYGGGEFVLYLEDVSLAVAAAERIRAAVDRHFMQLRAETRAATSLVVSPATGPLTVSIGIADVSHYPSVRVAVGAADYAMSQAYARGSNRIQMDSRSHSIDLLTGLQTRSAFDIALRRRLPSSAEGLGLLLCNVDALRRVNVRYGYDVGDELLCSVAIAFRPAPSSWSAARYGGDQFVAVVESCHPHDIERVAEQAWNAAVRAAARVRDNLRSIAIVDCDGNETSSREPFGVSLSALWVPPSSGFDTTMLMEALYDILSEMRRLSRTGYVSLRLPATVRT